MKKIQKFLTVLKTPWCRLLILGSILLTAYFYLSYFSLDPDFGWHLKAGQHILAHGVPKTDIFTYTAPGFAWINHSWLSDAITASLYYLGGYSLVALVFASIWTAAILIASRLRLYSVTLLAFVATMSFSGIRMVAWSVLFFAILERLMRSKKTWQLWCIPLMFLLWANLHGSFVLGLLILLLFQIFSTKKLPWLVVVVSFVATFINPYTYAVYIEVARTTFDIHLKTRISEWRALDFPRTTLPYIIAFIALHFSISKKPWRSILSIPGLLFGLSLSSIRHTPLFVVSSQRYFEEYVASLTTQINKARLNAPRKGVLIAICIFLLCITGWQIHTSINLSLKRDTDYPVAATDYLSTHPCSGNIFNDYNYGGYLVWKLPSSKIYIDGRMPSWQMGSEDYFLNYSKIMTDSNFRNEQFHKYNITCVLVRKNSPRYESKDAKIVSDLQTDGWHTISLPQDSESALLIKPNTMSMQ